MFLIEKFLKCWVGILRGPNASMFIWTKIPEPVRGNWLFRSFQKSFYLKRKLQLALGIGLGSTIGD